MLPYDCRIAAARRLPKTITEARRHHVGGRRIEVHVDRPPVLDEQRAQVVDAVSMIRVLMGVEHGIEPVDVGIEQLLAQIRRRIDQKARNTTCRGTTAFDQKRRAAAAVLRIVRIARAPTQGRARHSGGRAAAKDRELKRHAAGGCNCANCIKLSSMSRGRGTLEKSLKKLALVCRAMVSNETPRASANTLAVSTTKAGSLRLPRWRPGARYGASVSTRMRSAGSSAAMARSAPEFLNVRMPVNEMYRPSAMARRARSVPPVKQCSTAGNAPFPASSSRMRAV